MRISKVLDQVVKEFEHSLDSILIDCVSTPELDASFEKADAMPSSVPWGFSPQLAPFLIILDCSLLLPPGIRSHKLSCLVRALLLPVPQAGKMLASKLIHHFCSHGAAIRFQASLSPDNITLNPAKKKTDQSFLILRLTLVQLFMPL